MSRKARDRAKDFRFTRKSGHRPADRKDHRAEPANMSRVAAAGLIVLGLLLMKLTNPQ
jgi:hypothetical protein